jgi:toxin ParE1/3/4
MDEGRGVSHTRRPALRRLRQGGVYMSEDARYTGRERREFVTRVEQGLAQADLGETVPHTEAAQSPDGVMPIVWTFQAVQDMGAARMDSAPDSPQYAASVTAQLVAAVDRLADVPLSGAMVPELQDETIRVVSLGPFRVVYRVTPHDLQILTVFQDVVSRFAASS